MLFALVLVVVVVVEVVAAEAVVVVELAVVDCPLLEPPEPHPIRLTTGSTAALAPIFCRTLRLLSALGFRASVGLDLMIWLKVILLVVNECVLRRHKKIPSLIYELKMNVRNGGSAGRRKPAQGILVKPGTWTCPKKSIQVTGVPFTLVKFVHRMRGPLSEGIFHRPWTHFTRCNDGFQL